MESKIKRQSVQIRFNDVDIVGHVNNAVYLEYFDHAKMTFFNEVLGNKADWNKTGFVLAHISVDYHKPVFLDDKVEIHTRLSHIGNKSLNLIQEVIDPLNSEIKCTSNSVMVCFDYIQKEPIVLPASWKKCLEPMQVILSGSYSVFQKINNTLS
jgi:acyl-CoA thioester hydrolase